MLKLFLLKMRQQIELEKINLIPRAKNKELLEKIGWTPERMFQFLYEELTIDDYYRGQTGEIDGKFPDGTVYEFLKTIIEEETEYSIYIKMKIMYIENSEEICIVLSFHEAER
ncbi:MAG: hypothetical protein U9N62_03460 [Thermotogota bacterium]|nr:hypothetical protein [Thermotogota bacterium]